MKKLLPGLIALLFTSFVLAANPSSPAQLLNHSRQLLVVTTDAWDISHGQMRLYERSNDMQAWQAVGGPIHVTIGKEGLAWDNSLKQQPLAGPIKKEGDLKTPAGVFPIDSVFGFAPSSIKNIKMPYIQIMPDTVCVDDSNSKFYNRIINSKKIKNPDWKSGEQMHSMPQYMWGIKIDYNTKKPVANAGSCTFIHVWKDANQGTAGCVAMSESDIEQLITWLNAKRNPSIVILPKSAYKTAEKSWNLPA